ncbi:hypothetical protein LY76DRAFT_275302 [Colletotrichum caudatum]|nr:hypothetical protein LY76DRAFT_275302 [Colletotrichum caudatum]
MAPQTRNHHTSAQGSSSTDGYDGHTRPSRRPLRLPRPPGRPNCRSAPSYPSTTPERTSWRTTPSCFATLTCDNRRGFNAFARPVCLIPGSPARHRRSSRNTRGNVIRPRRRQGLRPLFSKPPSQPASSAMFSAIRVAPCFVDVLKPCPRPRPRPGPSSSTPSTPFLLLHWCRGCLRLCRCGPLYDPVRRRPLGPVLVRLAYIPSPSPCSSRRTNQMIIGARTRVRVMLRTTHRGKRKKKKGKKKREKKIRRIEGNSPKFTTCNLPRPGHTQGTYPVSRTLSPWQNPANWARFVVEICKERDRGQKSVRQTPHPTR